MGEGENEGESPGFDMPWHVVTLYEDQAQKIVAPTFFLKYFL